MVPLLSDSKGKVVGFDSPERASFYFLEVLLRLQPYAQATMIDRSYAPDCSYTHPLFQVPVIDLRGLPFPLVNKLNSRRAIKLFFRAKRMLLPQTVWKTESSAFDPNLNKAFVLMEHKLDLAFMPKMLSTLHFKVATTLQLKPIYITLSDQMQKMPNGSSGGVSNSATAAMQHRFDGDRLGGGLRNGDKMQNGCSMHNQLPVPAPFELPGGVNIETVHTEVRHTTFDRIHHEDHGFDAAPLSGLNGSNSLNDNRSGSGESCCCSPSANCDGSCTSCKCGVGGGLVLATRWVISSQEDMMQPKDILLCMLFLPTIMVVNLLQIVVSLPQIVESLLPIHNQAKIEAPTLGVSKSTSAHPCTTASERPAGPSDVTSDTTTMDTALLPEEYETARARAVEDARANVIESLANARAHLESLPPNLSDTCSFEDVAYGEEMDANYSMRYMKGKLLAEFNNSLQRGSGKSKSVRFSDESFEKENGDIADTKSEVECEH